MKAIQMRRTGGPEVLELVELPWPEPRPGEVRVRARAIGVGNPDVLVRRGTYQWMPLLPAIPGNEMAGVVDAVGDGVSSARIGNHVLVSARELSQRGGCYAEAICVPEWAPFALPDSVGFDDAASLANVQLALGLFASSGGLPARAVLLTGAAGGVASALAQVAKLRGARVIGIASSPAKRAFALQNGVDEALDFDPADLPERVLAATEGLGVDIAFDPVGGALFTACLRSLAPFGTLVSYNVVGGPPTGDVFAEMRRLLGKSLAVRTFSIHTLDADKDARRGMMQEAIGLMASGRVRAPASTSFQLGDAPGAHRALESRQSLGKILLHP